MDAPLFDNDHLGVAGNLQSFHFRIRGWRPEKAFDRSTFDHFIRELIGNQLVATEELVAGNDGAKFVGQYQWKTRR
jgi:hypothetical protein